MKTAVFTVVLLAGAVAGVAAQTAPQAPAEATVVAGGAATQPNPFRAQELQATSPTTRAHRWFDLQAVQAETRYRFIETSAGVTAANQWQHRQSLKAAFKFDEKGNYTIQSFMGTGNSFTGAWDPTGVGTGDPTWDFRVRRLYAQAIPVKGLELAAGSFDVVRGETTEITNFDNDAFMQGYRVSLKRPHELYLDEVSVTTGYLGDLTTTNVFKRFKWMNDHNYTQVFGAKKLSKSVALSADWSELNGDSTLREGVRLGTKQFGNVIDAVRFELYQRVDSPTGNGAAFTVERALNKSVSVNGGLASNDKDNGALNGDRYARGKRYFAGHDGHVPAGADAERVLHTRVQQRLSRRQPPALRPDPVLQRAESAAAPRRLVGLGQVHRGFSVDSAGGVASDSALDHAPSSVRTSTSSGSRPRVDGSTSRPA